MRSYRKYSLSEKLNILGMIDKNNSVGSIARDLEINRNVICQWKSLYDAEGIKGLEKKSKNNKYSNEFKL
ncbi:helix-turn-helix domain-containing protein [Companilactobacillus zhachilii]|uniref:helix-turn-helix domain-containing protein n=1 Tax=Companilactobacillus zhachilii TaxID=2304606 RepID=UPI004033DD7F